MMNAKDLIPHLFRTEFRKITSVLCKLFGMEHMEMAEDIASETFLSALESWTYKGIPENPTAWLYAVAKNKAKNHFNRHQTFTEKVTDQIKNSTDENTEIDWSDKNIADSQLHMLFAICRPSIPEEAQIALSLRILCGFGIEEIANAFLTNKETINKRIFRAKERLRMENDKTDIKFLSQNDINNRLETVLRTLYLLYNEGYYSESNDTILREDLCLEAMQLTYLLIQNEKTNLPKVNALLSLMCFHSSRFPARKNEHGEMVLYFDQDESLWNDELIAKGAYYLKQASWGDLVSKYHLEASIAYWHTMKADTKEKWENILQLYNKLLQIEYSPIAALNRTFALSKANGKLEAIREAEKLQLTGNCYYNALLCELYKDIDFDKSKQYLKKAILLAKTQTDKNILFKKLSYYI